MTLETVPASGKLREVRLGVRAATTEARRGVNLKGPYAPALREHWAGQIMFADLSRADMAALVAFFESLDGRITPFGVSLAASYFSRLVGGSASVSGTLAAAVVPGANVVKITLSGSPTLKRGTLVGIGDTAGTYQWCDVLEDAVANGSADVKIAPRIRYAFAASTTIVAGTVTAKLKLAGDDIDTTFNPAYGSLILDVIEAL